MLSRKLKEMARFASDISSDLELAITLGDFHLLRKETMIDRAMAKLPEPLRGLQIEITGDNWLGDNQIIPDFTASIAVTERDEGGSIICMALATARGGWPHRAVVASEEGVFVLTGDGGFEKIERVDKSLLGSGPSFYAPRVQIFGQKPTPHWVAMNKAIGFMNGLGIRVANDCGPWFAILGWFSIVKDGAIYPLNMAYCEPLANKPKEEIVAFLVECLNHGLPTEDQFPMTDMSGAPLFQGGEHRKSDEDTFYKASGYLIATTKDAHNRVLRALKEADEVTHFLDTTSLDPKKDAGSMKKMDTLRHDLALVR